MAITSIEITKTIADLNELGYSLNFEMSNDDREVYVNVEKDEMVIIDYSHHDLLSGRITDIFDETVKVEDKALELFKKRLEEIK